MLFQCSLYGVCTSEDHESLLEHLKGSCVSIRDPVDFHTRCLKPTATNAVDPTVPVRMTWPSENTDSNEALIQISFCGKAEPTSKYPASVRSVLQVPAWTPGDTGTVVQEVERFLSALVPGYQAQWEYRQHGQAFIYQDSFKILVTKLDPVNQSDQSTHSWHPELWLIEVHSMPVEQSQVQICCQELQVLSSSMAG